MEVKPSWRKVAEVHALWARLVLVRAVPPGVALVTDVNPFTYHDPNTGCFSKYWTNANREVRPNTLSVGEGLRGEFFCLDLGF